MLKKISFFFFLLFLFLEIFFRINYDLINLRVLYQFPDTSIKEKIINKIISNNQNKIFLKKFKNELTKLKDGKFLILPDEEDFELGAKNFIIYKNGFCNEQFESINFKILSVGDSFVNCNLLDNYSAWPKKIFGKNYKQSINLGKNGAGPLLYNKILENYINKNTKLVIYGFYEGNDLLDIFPTSKSIDKKSSSKKKNIKFFLKKTLGHSISLNLLFGIYKKKFDKYKFEKLYKPIKKNNIRFISNFSKKKFNTHNLDLDELEFAKKFLNLNNSEKNNYYEKLFQIFSEANFIVKKNNANIIFVYLPNTFTAFEDISIFENKENKIFLSKYSKISQKIFFNICNDLKLKCLNTVEIFKKHNQRIEFNLMIKL